MFYQWLLLTNQSNFSSHENFIGMANNDENENWSKLPVEHPRKLIPELCRLFYQLGWVTGSTKKTAFIYIK